MGCEISSAGSSFAVVSLAVLYKHCRSPVQTENFWVLMFSTAAFTGVPFNPHIAVLCLLKTFLLIAMGQIFIGHPAPTVKTCCWNSDYAGVFVFYIFTAHLDTQAEWFRRSGNWLWKPFIFPLCLIVNVYGKFFFI